jgi:outer membrane protein
MKWAFFLGLLVLVSAFPCLGAVEENAGSGKTLEECYEAALKRSETVAIAQETIVQAEDTYHQTIGGVLPNVSGVGSYEWLQSTPPGLTTFYPNPTTSTRLTVTQPIFQGFKEFAGLRQAKTLIGASEFDKRQAATQLYLDTAAAYFTVVSLEHDRDNVIDELKFYDDRIAELKQFRSIGRAQLTDVLTAQSQQAALLAQLKQDEGALRAERAVLSFLTGWDIMTPILRPTEGDKKSRLLEEYLSRMELRPDVLGDAARVKASEDGIPIARSGHFPTLGFQGDYYLQRNGNLNGVAWDVMLNLTVPIFAGGAVEAGVHQAVSKRDQAEHQVSNTRRLAEQQIKQFFETYVGDRNQFIAYRDATDLAEKNYREEIKSYRLGLVTNLDVLTALTTFQESKRSFDKARYSMLTDIEDLEAAGAYKPQVAAKKSSSSK